MEYVGAYASGPIYQEGDIAIASDGIAYICVKPNITTPPEPWAGITGPAGPPGPQGAQGPQGVAGPAGTGLPTVQNGKWLTGSGGAAVWASITQADLPINLGAVATNSPPPGNDLNNAKTNGWYSCDQDTPITNRPCSYGVVHVSALAATTLRQVCYEHASLNIYQRYFASNAWSNWVQIQWTPDGVWQNVVTTVGYKNGWQDYGGGFPPGRYRKMSNGMIVLSGLLNMSSWVHGQIAFTLPAGYRPTEYRHMVTIGMDSVATARVSNTGDVQLNYTTAGWLSLDNVSFFP
jgi:hypothetical protein